MNDILFEQIKLKPWKLATVRAHVQTDELCLAAVRRQGCTLEYVARKTPEICLAAVKHDSLALEFVPQPTAEMCVIAVADDEDALEFVKLPVDRILEPASGQLSDWLNVLTVCHAANLPGLMQTLFPLMKAIPLGKQYREEWGQVDRNSERPLLDQLMQLNDEVNRLAPNDEITAQFRHRVNQQVEWHLSATAARSPTLKTAPQIPEPPL